jgi:hypothetical protein
VLPRDRAQVTDLFGKLLRWPGVVSVTRWRPSFQEAPGRPVDLYGGVGRLPIPGDHDEGDAMLELAAPFPGPDDHPYDVLAAQAAAYPGHRIGREITGGRTRYVARSIGPGARPHTVVTDSPDEMFAVLDAARHSQALPRRSTPLPGSATPAQEH